MTVRIPTRVLPSVRVVVLLILSAVAMRAEAQVSDESAGVTPETPAEVQPPPETGQEPASDEDQDQDPADDTDEDPDDTEVGPIESKVGVAGDVLQQLQSASRERDGLFQQGPISVLQPPWREFNDKLDERLGLQLGLSYFVLFQYTTPGPEPRGGVAGDFDFFGRWRLIEGADGARGLLGFNIEQRHAFSEIPPSELDEAIGSIWRTTRGFSDSGFRVNELWWDQRLANDRIRFRLGTINSKHFYDRYRFKSQKLFFLSAPFSDSPTIAFPRNGFGAMLRVSPLEELHVTAGIGDANGTRRVGGFETFFEDREFFTALSIKFTPTFEGLGQGRYSVTLWHTDAASDQGKPSGRGISALIEQEVREGVVPFARYGYGQGADLEVEHLVAIGVGIEAPFGRIDDVFGLGGSWARPPGGNTRDQWGFEAFYRFQVTPVLQLTPGFQIIVNPSLNPAEDVVGVFELRLGLVY